LLSKARLGSDRFMAIRLIDYFVMPKIESNK